MAAHLTDVVQTSRVMNAAAAGTTDQNSSSVDMQGFDAVRFTASFGTLTATQVTSVKLQQSSDDGASDAWADIAGSDSGNLADTDDNKMVVVDAIRPQERYVRAVILRGTANAVIDGVTAELYRPRSTPVTQSATVALSEKLVTPIAGTA